MGNPTFTRYIIYDVREKIDCILALRCALRTDRYGYMMLHKSRKNASNEIAHYDAIKNSVKLYPGGHCGKNTDKRHPSKRKSRRTC